MSDRKSTMGGFCHARNQVENPLLSARRKGCSVGRKALDKFANMLIEDEEGFRIETATGKVVTASEIRLNTSVALPTRGNSITRNQAWRALKSYSSQLREAGLLEQ